MSRPNAALRRHPPAHLAALEAIVADAPELAQTNLAIGETNQAEAELIKPGSSEES